MSLNILPEQFNELVKNRRSVFPSQFDVSKKIPDELVKQILINATWAPNHGKTEPWFFKVFSGQGIHTFAGIQSKLYQELSGDQYKEEKYIKLQTTPLLASHIISIGMKRTTSKNIPEIEDVAAVACAVQNMYLTASVYGLGCYWTTGGITYLEKAKYYFGLEDQDTLMGFFYLAYIAVPSAKATRRPLEEKTQWVKE